VARDYYDVLGVSRDAGSEEIQQAFRRLARRYHPDVNKDPVSEERFKEVNEAYQVLSDPESRRRYDRFGPDFRQVPEGYEEATRPGSPFGGARTSGFPTGGFRGAEDVGIDFEDLFGGIFGARGGPIRGADQEVELELTIEDAYRGGHRTITLPGRRTYEVTIPPGVIDGQRIRLAGQGGHGSRRGSAGDLYLVVRIAPHPRYRLEGRDLHVELPLTPWEAVLGATVPVTTPGGEAKVRVPPGTSTGRRLRLRGEGMPNPRGRPGDLYAEVRVVVPRTASRRERELFEELAKESTFDPRRTA
jgi:curved DNA-binding protein